MFVVGKRTLERDSHGFLLSPGDWDEDVAAAIAAEESIRLGPDHWAVLTFMRDYLEEHGIAVDARHVFAFLGKRAGVGKRAARELFFDLFPYGYVKQACRIAGMKQPRAWSTG